MPLQIQRTATVYRLWDDDDLKALFVDHLPGGWLTTLTYIRDNDVAGFRVMMQNAESRQQVTATLAQVVVSDLVSVVAQSVADYNAENPGSAIQEPGS
jgi:hypothetical protein